MTTLTVEVPKKVCSILRESPDELAQDMRLTAAAGWYREGRISQEVAAEIAGLTRTDFLLALARMGTDSFQVDFDDLDRELARG